MNKKPVYVTQPFLPPLDELTPYLEKIWSTKILTNGGPYHQELEHALCNFLGVKYISLFNNGTLALITALQALKITGEVITTPYSFVATANSLLWNNITPIFVDIDPISLNLDPRKIECAITPLTSAIMPVHCYGNPCDVEAIEKIASKNNLKVIYDAAHAFGVKFKNNSILSYGNLSVLSFHATKVFNTFEGGAIVSQDAETKSHIDNLKNFGFIDETTVIQAGINGKMSELNAAIGLLQLRYINIAIDERKKIAAYYNQQLSGIKGITVANVNFYGIANHSYYPILIEDNYKITRDDLYNKLKANSIYSRRYFYPLISEFKMYKHFSSSCPENLPAATSIAKKVLCLPIFPSIEIGTLKTIVSLIADNS